MKLSYVLANLKLVERNRDWLAADIPASEKARYYPAMARSYYGLSRGESSVKYLGAPFVFDNPATPLNLQTYPYELTRKIRTVVGDPATILDIGGNIGQFTRTAKYLWPRAEVDVFEPNPAAFELMEQNTRHLPGVRRHHFAIGEAGTAEFYFEPGRSGTGSFLRENVGALDAVEQISVTVTDAPASVTGRDEYDLVKIDVEGHEMDVIERLAGVRCRCLYLEGSLGRSKPYSHDELFARIADSFGSFEIAYFSEVEPSMLTFEATLRFDDRTAQD